jgi:hypothetical protein
MAVTGAARHSSPVFQWSTSAPTGAEKNIVATARMARNINFFMIFSPFLNFFRVYDPIYFFYRELLFK